jgi:hypothetical protein
MPTASPLPPERNSLCHNKLQRENPMPLGIETASLPVCSETHDVTVRLAGVNPDQLAIEKELQSPIFARSVSVAVTDLGSLRLLFHRGYSLQKRRRMRQQLLSRFLGELREFCE